VLHGRKSRDTFVIRSGFSLHFHKFLVGMFLLQFIPRRLVRLAMWATNHIEQHKTRTLFESLLDVLFLVRICELFDRHLYDKLENGSV